MTDPEGRAEITLYVCACKCTKACNVNEWEMTNEHE